MNHVLRLDDLPRVPWKNGGGTTRELWKRNHVDGELLARVSVADVVADGPFSAYPGVDRVLVLLRGGGFRMERDGGLHVDMAPLQVERFPGDVAIMGRTTHGPVLDFNVFTRRGSAAADVRVLREATAQVEPGMLQLVLCVTGTARAGAASLGAADVLVVEAFGETLPVEAAGAAILVRITAA